MTKPIIRLTAFELGQIIASVDMDRLTPELVVKIWEALKAQEEK